MTISINLNESEIEAAISFYLADKGYDVSGVSYHINNSDRDSNINYVTATAIVTDDRKRK